MKKYLFLALSVVLIISACSKSSTPTQTRFDVLRAGRWKLSSGTIAVKQPNGKDTTLNYLNYVPSCHDGDYITFISPTLGAVMNSSTRCNAAEGDSSEFTWNLTNNDNFISFYRGFSLIWSVIETINVPYFFDTTSQSPLVLDTLHGLLDTLPGFVRTIPILDTLWNLTYVRDSVPSFNIYNATISNFSSSAFTIFFTMYSTYPDSIGHHEGVSYITDAITGMPDTIDLPPIISPDTFKYTLTYSSF